MLQKLLNNKGNVALALLLLFLLIAIRAFENVLFYDPFLAYFKSDYQNLVLPNWHPIKLFLSMGFRYYLNSMLSMGLIYLIFRDSRMIKFSIFLYSFFGMILLIGFFFVLKFFGEESKMMLFYIRRFIIQPLFLILFLPAFFYQSKIR